MKSQGITRVSGVHLLRIMNVSEKYHLNSTDSCCCISLLKLFMRKPLLKSFVFTAGLMSFMLWSNSLNKMFYRQSFFFFFFLLLLTSTASLTVVCWHMWHWALIPSGRLRINWDNVKDNNNGANLCLLLHSRPLTTQKSVPQITKILMRY